MNEALFIFYVHDQASSASFYEYVLGKTPRLDVPGMTEFQLTDSCILGLMPETGIKRLLPKLTDPASANGVARAELYLYVEEPAVAYARALEAGAKPLDRLRQRSWGDMAAYCLDPDGHVLAFATKNQAKALQRNGVR